MPNDLSLMKLIFPPVLSQLCVRKPKETICPAIFNAEYLKQKDNFLHKLT